MASVPSRSIPHATTTVTEAAPATAREARALTDQLDAQESALEKAKRRARNTAAYTEAERAISEASGFDKERDRATAAWNLAAADPAIGVEGLFTAFVAMRSAHACRSAHLVQAGAVLDKLEPLRTPISGQPGVLHVNNAVDPLLGAEFGPAVEDVIRSRVGQAANVVRRAVQTRTDTAGQAAADREH